MTKTFKLFKGGKKRDIYEDAKWKKRGVDIDGETYSGIPVLEQEEVYDYKLRRDAMEVVREITSDPIEQEMARLMLENYTDKDMAEILDISPARVEWFMRKISGWKRKEGK